MIKITDRPIRQAGHHKFLMQLMAKLTQPRTYDRRCTVTGHAALHAEQGHGGILSSSIRRNSAAAPSHERTWLPMDITAPL
jgi:hypothetical protein